VTRPLRSLALPLAGLALVAASGLAPAATAADDHPNTKTGAALLSLGSPRSGVIEAAGDVDVFALDVVRMTTYTLTTTLRGLPDSVLEVFDTDGATRLAENDDDGQSLASKIVWTPIGTGRVFVRVRGYDAAVGAYAVVATATTPSSPAPAGPAFSTLVPPPPGDDHWGIAERATPVLPDEWVYATIERSGDVDVFSFSSVMGARYAVETHLISLPDSSLALLDPDDALVLGFSDDYAPWAAYAGFEKAARVDWTAPKAARYFVHVGTPGTSAATGTYRFRVRRLWDGAYPAAPGSVIDDVGDTPYTARALADGQTVRARADRLYDVDMFQVTLTAGVPVRVQTGNLSIVSTVIWLDDDLGRPLARASAPFRGSRLDYTPRRSGTYFVRVEPTTGYRGEYWVRAQQGAIADSGFDETQHLLRAPWSAAVDFAAAEVARQYFLLRPAMDPLGRLAVPSVWTAAGLSGGALGTALLDAKLRAVSIPAPSATAASLNTSLVGGTPVTLILSGTDGAGRTVRHAVVVTRAAQVGTRVRYYVHDPKDGGTDLDDALDYDTAARTFAPYVHGGIRYTQALTAAAAGIAPGTVALSTLPAGANLPTRVAIWLRIKVTGR
jgi:hypothetical protein